MDIIKKRGFTISIFTICVFAAIVFMSAMSQKERITIYTIGDSTMADKDTVGNGAGVGTGPAIVFRYE